MLVRRQSRRCSANNRAHRSSGLLRDGCDRRIHGVRGWCTRGYQQRTRVYASRRALLEQRRAASLQLRQRNDKFRRRRTQVAKRASKKRSRRLDRRRPCRQKDAWLRGANEILCSDIRFPNPRPRGAQKSIYHDLSVRIGRARSKPASPEKGQYLERMSLADALGSNSGTGCAKNLSRASPVCDAWLQSATPTKETQLASEQHRHSQTTADTTLAPLASCEGPNFSGATRTLLRCLCPQSP